MKIFNYSAIDGKLINESDADVDPMEPGNFLIPAYATPVEPPIISAGFEAFFENSQWILKQITVPPALTPEQLMQEAVNSVKHALQSSIDAKARESGFSSGNAYMLYAGFTNPFKASALIFAQWEASVWAQAGAYKAQVLAGTAPMLTPEQAVAMMPVYPG